MLKRPGFGAIELTTHASPMPYHHDYLPNVRFRGQSGPKSLIAAMSANSQKATFQDYGYTLHFGPWTLSSECRAR